MTQPNDPADPEHGHDEPDPSAPEPAEPLDPPLDTESPGDDPDNAPDSAASLAPEEPTTADEEPPAADEAPGSENASAADEPGLADDAPAGVPTSPPEPEEIVTSSAEDIAEDTAEEHEPLGSSRSGSPSWALVVAVLLGVVIVGVGAYLLGAGSDDDTVATTTTTTDEATTPTVDPDIEFTEFDDPETGVSFRYPSDWVPLQEDDPSVPIILSAGGSNSLLVRVVPIEEAVTEENLPNLKATTDGILDDAGVSILEETPFEVNGMPGYFYLYLIDDTATGQRGAHAHYFLFKEATMNILVFQSVPVEAFTDLAPVFDEIVNSFESDPPDVLPGATTTTAPTTATTTTATTTTATATTAPAATAPPTTTG